MLFLTPLGAWHAQPPSAWQHRMQTMSRAGPTPLALTTGTMPGPAMGMPGPTIMPGPIGPMPGNICGGTRVNAERLRGQQAALSQRQYVASTAEAAAVSHPHAMRASRLEYIILAPLLQQRTCMPGPGPLPGGGGGGPSPGRMPGPPSKWRPSRRARS